MMTISAKYLIIMLTLAIIMAVFSILGIKKSRELLTKEVVEEASATAYFNEIVHAINIVKMKGNEDYIFNVWDDLFARQMHSMKNKGNYMATMMSIISSIQFIAPLILFALSVQDALNNEKTARINTYNDLSNAISQEEAKRAEKDTELTQDISREITARQNADIALNVSIEEESSRAINKEDQIIADYTAADSILSTNINTLRDDLVTENTRAIDAEENLD